jgi:CRP/FNR family transcriptional regulator, cyclic AMP receptor protein
MNHTKNSCDVSSENQNLQARIAAHPFLLGMDVHQIGMMATYALPAHFTAGEIIFRTGELANRFYLIESGIVVIEGKMFDEPSVIMDTLSTGDALGWSWLFPPYLWHFDARATEPTVALSFDTATLRRHYEEDLTLAHELFKRMSQVMVGRLQTARRKLIEGAQKSPR